MGGDNEGSDALAEVLLDTSIPGRVKVTWKDWSRFGAGQRWDVSASLFVTGQIRFEYGFGFAGFNANDIAGVSIGDAVGTGGEPWSELTKNGDTGSLGLLYQNQWTDPFGLEDAAVLIQPNGLGGFSHSIQCGTPPPPPASHTEFGAGCYDGVFAAAYQQFPNASAAETALEGKALVFAPNAAMDGYQISDTPVSLPATFAVTTLALGDDDEVDVNLLGSFDYLGTALSSVSVCSNGFVNMGPIGNNAVDVYGSVASFNTTVIPSFRCNLDLDPSGIGEVQYRVDSLLLPQVQEFRWNGVQRYNDPASIETFGIQLLATGEVRMFWSDLSATSTGDMLVGYSPGGAVLDNPVDFASDLPVQTSVDVADAAVSLSADVPAVSTGSTGTIVTYTVGDAPDFASGLPGLKLGLLIVSFAPSPVPGGIDLGFLGAPECALQVNSLDVLITLDAFAASAAIPYGPLIPYTSLYLQAAMLSDTSDPSYSDDDNYGNTFGVRLSNPVRTTISSL